MRQRTRLIINVLTNYGTFFIYGVANFILVGYVIRRLGKDAFGIAVLVMSLTIITELLGRGVCQALTKYVAAAVGKSDFDKANGFINTSLVWLSGCGLVGAVIYGGLAGYIDKIFNVPPSLVSESQLALLLMGLRVLLCFPFNTFQSVLWAYQRYDLTNLAKSITTILRVLLVIAYFELVSAGVVELMAITIVTLIIERILWVVFSFRTAENLRFGLSFVSVKTCGALVSFGGFILIIHVANMIGYEAVKWVVGLELSVMDVGAYSLIAALAVFAGTMGRSIANVLMPVASHYDALEQHDLNAQLALVGTKYAMVVSGVVCLVPLFLLKPFLTLWVGGMYSAEYMSQVALAGVVLLVGQWFITTAVCILQMLTGVGKVLFPATVTMSWAVGGLGGVWAYLHWCDGSLFAAVVGITIARVLGSMVHLIYGMHILHLPPGRFFLKSILKPACAGIVACISSWLLKYYFDSYKVSEFVAVAIILLALYSLITWTVTLTLKERAAIIGKIRLTTPKLKF